MCTFRRYLFILNKDKYVASFGLKITADILYRALSCQDGRHSAVALLLKAALIQVSDYRLLGASGIYNPV
jgi:hypothetical protein